MNSVTTAHRFLSINISDSLLKPYYLSVHRIAEQKANTEKIYTYTYATILSYNTIEIYTRREMRENRGR